MHIPLWIIIPMILLILVNGFVDVFSARFIRHHDHLIPDTPRAPRG